MTALEVVLIIVGIICVLLSFVVKEDDLNIDIKEISAELTEVQKEKIKSQINSIIDEEISDISEKTEAKLDSISNTKILEMNEYADNVLGEINRNHNEVVFLYDMLNEKAKDIKSTVKDVNITKRQVEKIHAEVKAVDDNAALLRASASCPGNDQRLGGNEAPPAIISVFLGEQLEDILAQIKENGVATESKQGGRIDTGVHTLPAFRKDATDRNRTSPFAFTGNKFEFRTVGSSMSIAGVNAILNTIVSDVLCEFADELEKAEDFEKAVRDLIAKTVREHDRIIFSGNGYSEEWVKEAERRGLPNIPSMVEAIPALTEERVIRMFEKHKVFSAAELHSRAEIQYEIYSKAINIEARTMLDMAAKQYIPAVIQYATELANSINSIRQACPEAEVSVQTSILKELSTLLTDAKKARETLAVRVEEAMKKPEGQERGLFFRKSVVPVMEELRSPIDKLEMLVPKNAWPVPSYGDLLFEQ